MCAQIGCESHGRQAQAREVDMKAQHLSLPQRDRLSYLRALASLEPCLCTLASRAVSYTHLTLPTILRV